MNPISSVTSYLIDNLTLAVPTEPALAFYYDDRGHRVRKENYVYAGDEPIRDITWYVRDASGSPLAIYQGTADETQTTADLKELPIYGLSRLGIYQKYMNDYVYQLTDHLGNVRATLRRGKDNELYVVGATDYYPFGMPMPNRQITGSENYRYGYQGEFAETDPETGKPAFELRLWDSRIGRWLSTDPAKQYASPYMGMGNNPIITYDKDGAIGENDYRLNKDGSIELIALTGDNFDRLFVDGVENPFIINNQSLLSDLFITQSFGASYAFGNSDSRNDVFKIFIAGAHFSDREWMVGKTWTGNYFVGSSREKAQVGIWKDAGISKSDIYAFMHSHPGDLIADQGSKYSQWNSEIASMGYGDLIDPVTVPGFTSNRTQISWDSDWGHYRNSVDSNNGRASHYSYVYVPKTSRLWRVGYNEPHFIRNIHYNYNRFFFGTF